METPPPTGNKRKHREDLQDNPQTPLQFSPPDSSNFLAGPLTAPAHHDHSSVFWGTNTPADFNFHSFDHLSPLLGEEYPTFSPSNFSMSPLHHKSRQAFSSPLKPPRPSLPRHRSFAADEPHRRASFVNPLEISQKPQPEKKLVISDIPPKPPGFMNPHAQREQERQARLARRMSQSMSQRSSNGSDSGRHSSHRSVSFAQQPPPREEVTMEIDPKTHRAYLARKLVQDPPAPPPSSHMAANPAAQSFTSQLPASMNDLILESPDKSSEKSTDKSGRAESAIAVIVDSRRRGQASPTKRPRANTNADSATFAIDPELRIPSGRPLSFYGPASSFGGAIDCVCRKTSSEKLLIECASCRRWSHAQCVNGGLDLPRDFVCSKCRSMTTGGLAESAM